jgi:hypothetical protein
MTVVDLEVRLQELVKAGHSTLGKPRLVGFLADSNSSSARILTVRLQSGDAKDVLVLKQLKTLHTLLYCKWGGTSNPPDVVAGQDKINVLEIVDEKPKLKTKKLDAIGKDNEKKEEEQEKQEQNDDKGIYVPFEYCVSENNEKLKILEASEFFVEAGVDFLIKSYVSPTIPYFLTSEDIWRSRRHGNILLKKAGFDINTYFPFFGLVEIQALVVQIMHAIAWAQELIQLKHHDLHCGNVFVLGETKKLKTLGFPNSKIKFLVPAHMPKVLIGDYGLSSASDPKSCKRLTRADFHLMETNSGSSTRSDSTSNVSSGSSRSDSSSSSDSSDSYSSRSSGSFQSSSSSSSHSDTLHSLTVDRASTYSSAGSKSFVSESSQEDRTCQTNENEKNVKCKISVIESSDSEMDEEMDDETSEVDENDWGEWTHELKKDGTNRHMGYDIACFVSNLQEEAEERNHESLHWLTSLLMMMKSLDNDFILTRRGRPLTSTNFTIQQLAEKMGKSLLPIFHV